MAAPRTTLLVAALASLLGLSSCTTLQEEPTGECESWRERSADEVELLAERLCEREEGCDGEPAASEILAARRAVGAAVAWPDCDRKRVANIVYHTKRLDRLLDEDAARCGATRCGTAPK